jgi:putative transposase
MLSLRRNRSISCSEEIKKDCAVIPIIRLTEVEKWRQPGNGDAQRLTVIIQDNASVHRSKLTQQQWERWQQQGLLLFFLPPYSPQMNRIEDEWLHLKRDELNCQVFADEYDLAMAIADGLETRAVRGQYAVERFRFN